MTVTRYGYGPELVSGGLTQKSDGTLLEIPGGGGQFTLDVGTDLEADALLDQLGDVFIDGEWVRPVYSSPQRVGGRPLPLGLTEVAPETKRVMRVTLPPGKITKLRVYADGNGSGPGDPQLRLALANSSGTVLGTTGTLVLGRNRVNQSAFVNGASTVTMQPDGSFKVVAAAGSGNGGTFGTNGAFGCFPGEQMYCSAEVRGEVGGEQVVLQPRYGSSSNSYVIDQTSGPITLTDEWKTISYQAAVPSGTDGAVSPSLKVLLATSGGGTFYMRNGMWHRGTIGLPFHLDRVATQWYELPLTAPVDWPGGDGYLVVHVGSDIAQATTATTLGTASVAYNATFSTDTSGWTAIGSASISRDTTWSYYSGTGSLRIDWTSATLSGARLVTTNNLSPGDVVLVYSRLKGTSTTSTSVTQAVSVGGTPNVATTNTTLVNTTSQVEAATQLNVERTGPLHIDFWNTTAGFTGSALVDAVRIVILRRSSSDVSSLRLASTVQQPKLVTTTPNIKAKTDATGFAGWPGGGTSTQSSARVTTDAAMPFGSATCMQFTGTGDASAPVGAYMMGPASGRIPRGMKVGVVLAVKLVSGSVTNFQFGLRAVDSANLVINWITLGTITNPTAGRWYYFTGTHTTADEYAGCQPTVVTTVPTNGSYVTRLGVAELVPSAQANPIYIDGDLPDGAASGSEGGSEIVAPVGRVNWVRDPLTVTSGQWSANQCATAIEADSNSPTGSRVVVKGNTGIDPFVSPLNLNDINNLRVPALHGETWTLSGWWAVNAAMLNEMNAMAANNVKQGPSVWHKNDNTYAAFTIPSASSRPKVPGVYVPFSIVVTMPQWNTSTFVRLYNGATASAAAESYYTGLKFERGSWPAGDYFTGESEGSQWYGVPNQSESVVYSGYDVRDDFTNGTANLPTLTPASATGGESSIQALYT